ncbi:hypothetical protein A3194_12555 [Candidatus Thiodiazotropha endoloripes]|uniref:hypothetical protein n=1 Tax=Candidatus Thiodiazotropha endoloripes TaxID=1818881 RepID=UPI00083E259E|nr:hypothetical protein [Candidatus Thiodiazotropha endoloripes]ODB85658.1 hypothetical protein A3194_12555 [Candidatus Thiodiazotropha endoloripes]
MKIEIQRVKGFEYKARSQEFPIIVAVISDKPVEIAKKVDINSALLTKSDDEGVCFGFSQCITGLPGDAMAVDSDHPHQIELDVFMDDDEFEGFVEGKYKLKVIASVFEKQSSGEFNLIELSDDSEFMIE